MHSRALFAELLGEQPIPQAGEPLGVEPPATGPAADRPINNTVPLSVPGNEPWRIS